MIRFAFLAVLIGIYAMIYRQVNGDRSDGSRAEGDATSINVPQRHYRFRVPGRDWKRLKEGPKVADFVLARANPDALFWIQSGENSAEAPPVALLESMRAEWVGELTDFDEIARDTAIVAGQPARRLVGTGRKGGAMVRRVGHVFSHGPYWYRLVYETPAESADTIEPECQFALGGFRWTGSGVAADGGPSEDVFEGIAFDYRLRTPAGAWQWAADLPSESRFADLKLATPDRLVSLIVSPRPESTISQLESLYRRRQEKLFEGRVTFKSPDEDLEINGRPARRTRAVVVDESGREEFLVAVFVQGDGISYQIEARGPEDRAVDLLPMLEEITSTFETGLAAPKTTASGGTNDSREDNHFRKAPAEFDRR